MTNKAIDQHSRFEITVDEEIKIRGFYIKPENPICSLIVVHGVGEHSMRYLSLAKELSSIGCTCYFYDHRGHGISDGKRGHISKFDDYSNDLLKVFKYASKESKNHPIFIYGHSMGSVIATIFTINHQDKIRGLILTGFPFSPSILISGYPLKIIKWIGKKMPLQYIPTLINVKQLCHDQHIWEIHKKDRLINNTVTITWVAEFYSALGALKKNLYKLKLPLLIMHGSEDTIARLKGARQAVPLFNSADKTFKIFDGQRHELLNELPPIPEQVIDGMQKWILQKLKR